MSITKSGSELIPIYYFSASGNTEYAVTIVKKGIEARWPESTIKLIDIDSIKHFPFPNLNDNYPSIGLGFPVYEFMIPRIILIWLHQLPAFPADKPCKIFLISTSGGLSCDSANIARQILRKKNYQCIGILELPTPTAEPFFDNRYYHAGWAPELLDRCYYFGKLIAKRLQKGDPRSLDIYVGNFRFSVLTRWAYRYFMEGQSTSASFLRFSKIDCIRCGLCEQNCPINAIDLKAFPHILIHNRCMLCTTCVRTCPQKAITISYRPKARPPTKQNAVQSRPGYIAPNQYTPMRKPYFGKSLVILTYLMMRIWKTKKAS